MNRKALRKNRLDLEYKFEAQQANIYLTLGTITFVGFLGVTMAYGKSILGLTLGLALLSYAYSMRKRTKLRMKQLLNEIERI